MLVMGIDPGLNGGLAILNEKGRIILYRRMPTKPYISSGKSKKQIDIAQISAVLAKIQPEHVFIEKASARPGQGVVSMFTFGVGYGMILGVCLALEQVFQTEVVVPQRWQKMLYPENIGDLPPKERALRKAWELWPEIGQQNVTHDGIVDALLIAEFGRRMLNLQ